MEWCKDFDEEIQSGIEITWLPKWAQPQNLRSPLAYIWESHESYWLPSKMVQIKTERRKLEMT